jgi:hypothetical protein
MRTRFAKYTERRSKQSFRRWMRRQGKTNTRENEMADPAAAEGAAHDAMIRVEENEEATGDQLTQEEWEAKHDTAALDATDWAEIDLQKVDDAELGNGG